VTAESTDQEHRILDAVQDALRREHMCPDSGALMTELVLIAGWIDSDGDHGWSLVRCGSPWATRGLLDMATEHVDGESLTDDE
jgi:hypothetical protein